MTIFKKLQCLLESSNVKYVIMTDLDNQEAIQVATGTEFLTILPIFGGGVDIYLEAPVYGVSEYLFEVIDCQRFTSLSKAFKYINDKTNGSLQLMR